MSTLRGGLPSWFELSDRQVTRLRELTMMATLAFFFFVGLLVSDPLSFAGFGVMLLFVILPIASASALILPTYRLRLFWLPAGYGLAAFAMFFLVRNDDGIRAAIVLMLYIFCGLSVALAVPELRWIKRFLPSLLYVDRFRGGNEGGASHP